MIHPVILSGGSGTRLWPMSRTLYPKPLLSLLGHDSLLQQTVRRVADRQGFASPLLVANEEHRFIIAEQLREIAAIPRALANSMRPRCALACRAPWSASRNGNWLSWRNANSITSAPFRSGMRCAKRAARASAPHHPCSWKTRKERSNPLWKPPSNWQFTTNTV